MIKVKSHSDLYRDEDTGAIVNVGSEYTKYIQERDARANKEIEIETLKSEVTDIKNMMLLILEKLNDKN